MKFIEVYPVARCRHCYGDRPHRPLKVSRVMACMVCGTWRFRP